MRRRESPFLEEPVIAFIEFIAEEIYEKIEEAKVALWKLVESRSTEIK